ncbi:MAG: DUF4249 domain-containing protein [Chlorobi bacterium]|nr:DUF4249 domain-containing protein [Chlorobiota bacterium]
MRVIRFRYFLILLVVFFNSCVEKYFLDESFINESRVVVDALITNQADTQLIKLSIASSPEKHLFIPLSNCLVKVINYDGVEFIFNESDDKPGYYEGIIDPQFLNVGSKLKLYFITPEEKEYESDYEEFKECPPVDSIYYSIEHKLTNDPNNTLDGAQFYLNLVSSAQYSRYYYWQVIETWEYHSVAPIKMYYDGVLHNGAIDYSLYYCYRTKPINEIFILNTENLEQNGFEKFPLHFVDNLTQRLLYKYSLLVKQYTISESTYYFWKNMKKNSFESGGMFDSQPVIIQGNIYNIVDKDEVVLGNFSVATMNEKRIIIEDVQGLSFDKIPSCDAIPLEERLSWTTPLDWPIYFAHSPNPDGTLSFGVMKSDCIDCTLRGGTTKKPNYW